MAIGHIGFTLHATDLLPSCAENPGRFSPIDMASLDKWEEYTKAKEAMFFETDTADAPWTVIKSDCKKRARLNSMRYVLQKLPYSNKDPKNIGALDSLIVGRAHVVCLRTRRAPRRRHSLKDVPHKTTNLATRSLPPCVTKPERVSRLHHRFACCTLAFVLQQIALAQTD